MHIEKKLRNKSFLEKPLELHGRVILLEDAIKICKELINSQRKLDIELTHKIADDCYNRKIINHKEIDDMFNNSKTI